MCFSGVGLDDILGQHLDRLVFGCVFFKPARLTWGLSAVILNRHKRILEYFPCSTNSSRSDRNVTFNIYDILESTVWLDDRQCQSVARNNGAVSDLSTHVECFGFHVDTKGQGMWDTHFTKSLDIRIPTGNNSEVSERTNPPTIA